MPWGRPLISDASRAGRVKAAHLARHSRTHLPSPARPEVPDQDANAGTDAAEGRNNAEGRERDEHQPCGCSVILDVWLAFGHWDSKHRRDVPRQDGARDPKDKQYDHEPAPAGRQPARRSKQAGDQAEQQTDAGDEHRCGHRCVRDVVRRRGPDGPRHGDCPADRPCGNDNPFPTAKPAPFGGGSRATPVAAVEPPLTIRRPSGYPLRAVPPPLSVSRVLDRCEAHALRMPVRASPGRARRALRRAGQPWPPPGIFIGDITTMSPGTRRVLSGGLG